MKFVLKNLMKNCSAIHEVIYIGTFWLTTIKCLQKLVLCVKENNYLTDFSIRQDGIVYLTKSRKATLKQLAYEHINPLENKEEPEEGRTGGQQEKDPKLKALACMIFGS